MLFPQDKIKIIEAAMKPFRNVEILIKSLCLS